MVTEKPFYSPFQPRNWTSRALASIGGVFSDVPLQTKCIWCMFPGTMRFDNGMDGRCSLRNGHGNRKTYIAHLIVAIARVVFRHARSRARALKPAGT